MTRNGRRDGFRVGDGGRKPYVVPTVLTPQPKRPIGLKDPAYIADTPHDFWMAAAGKGPYRATRSAEELESWLREAPSWEEIRELHPLSRERYDGGGRLLAKWILEHFGRHPQDVRVPEVLARQLGSEHPELPELMDSTPRWTWAVAAALRVWDAHQLDG